MKLALVRARVALKRAHSLAGKLAGSKRRFKGSVTDPIRPAHAGPLLEMPNGYRPV